MWLEQQQAEGGAREAWSCFHEHGAKGVGGGREKPGLAGAEIHQHGGGGDEGQNGPAFWQQTVQANQQRNEGQQFEGGVGSRFRQMTEPTAQHQHDGRVEKG
jgi:hypothetical protein